MGQEIDLMAKYPRVNRDLDERALKRTQEDRLIAQQFGKEFFDGDRRYGYGGYRYHPRFWQPVIPDFQRHFQLSPKSRVLDVGCGKGFMLYDLMQLIPGIRIDGVDISSYAIENAKQEVKPFLKIGNARQLPYPDKSFDVVFSITTIHNLDLKDCKQALREITRVAKQGSFITVDAYRNEEEKKRMDMWNLTAKTYMHVNEWKDLFREAGYTGDYYWFIP